MSAEENPTRWWQTVPAMLGALATLVGAVTGLLIALNRTNMFKAGEPTDPAPNKVEPDRGGGAPSGAHETPAGNFRIVDISLRADPFNYVGKCPVKIVFSGRISTAGGDGTVSYRFIRNDGASAPVQTVHFNGPGSKNVTSTWTLGAATPRFQPYNGWQSIKVFDPQETESEKVTFKIYCQ